MVSRIALVGGHSVGREGSAVHLGAGTASQFGQLLKTPHFYKIENQTTDNIGSSPLKLIDNFDSRKKGNYQFYNLNKEFMFEQQF